MSTNFRIVVYLFVTLYTVYMGTVLVVFVFTCSTKNKATQKQNGTFVEAN